MREHYLVNLFSPKCIAVVGASDKLNSLGQIVFSNLISQENKINIIPVNLKHKLVGGCKAFKNIIKIDESIDLVVVTSHPSTYMRTIEECCKVKVKYVMIIRSHNDLDEGNRAMLNSAIMLAKQYQIRIVGPSYLGMIRPKLNLNCGTYSSQIRSGNIALLSHSSGLCSSILNMAQEFNIGFSTILSLGELDVDIDFAEVLDYLAHDHNTSGILMHIHHVKNRRKLISSLHAIAKLKPVIVIKSGHLEYIEDNILSKMIKVEKRRIFNHVLSRTGVSYAANFSEMLASIRVLSANYRVKGDRLAIVSNGSGLGILATDVVKQHKIKIAPMSVDTEDALRDMIPKSFIKQDFVDIFSDASPLRFRSVVKLCLEDKNVDAVLLIFAPNIGVDENKTAELLVKLQKETTKPILIAWLSAEKSPYIQNLFSKNKILKFNAPEYAVKLFESLVVFYRNQELLKKIPVSNHSMYSQNDLEKVRTFIKQFLQQNKLRLSVESAKKVLMLFKIPHLDVVPVKTLDEAFDAAKLLGFPLVMKLDNFGDIDEKGQTLIELNINNAKDIIHSYQRIMEDIKETGLQLENNTIIIQPMIRDRFQRIAKVCVMRDSVFGPVITFGSGGAESFLYYDYEIALPPLNEMVVMNLIANTHIGKFLLEHQDVNLDSLHQILYRISDLISDCPEIKELAVDICITQEQSVILNSVIFLDDKLIDFELDSHLYHHMAIKPYPIHLLKEVVLKNDTKVILRPIREQDAEILQNFVQSLSGHSRYNRFMFNIKQLSNNLLVKFCQIDYDRDFAFVVVKEDDNHESEILGISQYFIDPTLEVCEFAIAVSDQYQGQGIAIILMNELFTVAKQQGLSLMVGEVLKDNKAMLSLMRKLGFEILSVENKGYSSTLFFEKKLE